MIINIGSRLDVLRTYLLTLPAVSGLFGTQLYAGKPIVQPSGLYCYFALVQNTEHIGSDRRGVLKKEALFDFYIVGPDKDTPEVVLYETLDTLSNAIITRDDNDKIPLDGTFFLNGIHEGTQSGVLREVNETPLIIAQYTLTYQYSY